MEEQNDMKRIIVFAIAAIALAMPRPSFAQKTTEVDSTSRQMRLNIAITPEVCLGARLVASGDYLWSGRFFEVGGGLAADYGFAAGDLWLCPYGRIDLFKFLYFKGGLAFLAWPWVATDSYIEHGGEDYFVDARLSPFFSSGFQFGGLSAGPGKVDFDIHLTISMRPLDSAPSGLSTLGTLLQGGAGLVYRL